MASEPICRPSDMVPLLRGQRILLRPAIERDIEDRLACGRHAEIVRMWGGDARNLGSFAREDAVAWYQGYLLIQFPG
jgi:hypothetical protein